jgi:hypothetical protein
MENLYKPKYRMYVDEVGSASSKDVKNDEHKYLSLTGLKKCHKI